MNKGVRILLAVVGIVVLLVLVALLAHPLWVGPLVKSVAEKVGPKYTGTPIVLSDCQVNLYSGHFELTGFSLLNPPGCSEVAAAEVGSLKVDFDTLSALSDVVNVRQVEVSGVFVSYVKSAAGKYNFIQIADNAKAATGADVPAEEKPDDKEAVTAKSGGKKVVIGRLAVSQVRVAMLGVKATLIPGTVVLTDIGRKSNGATFSDAWEQVSEQLLKSSGAVGKQLSTAWTLNQDYGNRGVEFGKKGLDVSKTGLKSALESAKNLDVKGAKETLKNTGDSLKSLGNDFKGMFK